jgi:hypothetical protein
MQIASGTSESILCRIYCFLMHWAGRGMVTHAYAKSSALSSSGRIRSVFCHEDEVVNVVSQSCTFVHHCHVAVIRCQRALVPGLANSCLAGWLFELILICERYQWLPLF